MDVYDMMMSGQFNQQPGLGSIFNGNDNSNTGVITNTPMTQSAPQAYQFGNGSAATSALPNQQVAGVPVYSDAGTGYGGTSVDMSKVDPALKNTLTAGGQGFAQNGIEAFTGGLQDLYSGMLSGNTNSAQNSGVQGQQYDNLYNFLNSVGDTQSSNMLKFYQNTGDQQGTANYLRGLSQQYKDYVNIGGLSSGWDGSGQSRSAANTIYKDNGQGQLIPVTNPSTYTAPTNNGYFKSEQGQDLIGALSVMAPAVGGFAGLANMAAPAATGAVSSAIGSTATNALLNGAGNWLLSGGNGGLGGLGTSVLGSGLGQVGAAAGNSLMGNANGLGSLFSSAGSIGQSPMNAFSNLLSQNGSPLGGYASLLGGLGGNGISTGSLANAGAGLLGSYAASQIDPRLAGLGRSAGSGLANLFTR